MLESVEGSPYFQPPEAHDQNVHKYSGTKFDIWSSGVTLFYMITGQYPFDDSNDFFNNVLKNEVKYPEEILEDKQLKNLLQSETLY